MHVHMLTFSQADTCLELEYWFSSLQAADILARSATLPDANKSVAENWALGPHTVMPPGKWVQIAAGAAVQRVSPPPHRWITL